jgi:hypothetical protein
MKEYSMLWCLTEVPSNSAHSHFENSLSPKAAGVSDADTNTNENYLQRGPTDQPPTKHNQATPSQPTSQPAGLWHGCIGRATTCDSRSALALYSPACSLAPLPTKDHLTLALALAPALTHAPASVSGASIAPVRAGRAAGPSSWTESEEMQSSSPCTGGWLSPNSFLNKAKGMINPQSWN